MSVGVAPRRRTPISTLELGYATMHFSPKLVANGPDVFSQIEAAARAGFAWIALDRHTLALHHERGDLQEVADACEQQLPCREMQALVVGDDPAVVLATADRLVEQGLLLRPQLITTALTAPPSERVLESLQRAIDVIGAALPEVRFGIEFSPLFTVTTIDEGRRLMRRLERPQVGLIVDSWHFFFGRSSWSQLERLPLADLALVHFNDHGPRNRRPLKVEKDRRAIPGQGQLALDAFASAILAKGYRGGVEIEVISEALRGLSAAEYAELTFDASAPYWSLGASR